jgi:aminopeptidase N
MEPTAVPTDRLTQEEARARAESVADVAYDLDLDLAAGAKVFRGDVTIAFSHRGGDTFLEFIGGTIDRFEVNGSAVEPRWDGSRITLAATDLAARNEVRITYERGYDHTGEGFHQFIDPEDDAEYLFTQFEPYSAHRLFPCFDQPDLKAVYRVAVTAPGEWEVVSAGAEIERQDLPDGRSRRVFAETKPFSTYLLAVVAGPFHAVRSEHGDIPLGLFCRKSLAGHLDAENLFDTTRKGIDFYEEFFDQPYPFGKYDQLFVPEFNWGGMENVGTVTYTDTVVFRDPPTKDQLTRRAEYLMHELAHMWFGDLVTMEWWNDLWLNESFASFVAYLALDDMGGYPEIWQDFNFRMKLWAYREDQRPTTHRIADEVPSTDETFLNFDGITYGKGAATLKQLVAAIGTDGFRDGMRTYFRRHAFGNATLADFLAALQEGSGKDLVAWAARWLKTPSLNTISAEWEAEGERIGRLDLVQTAPEEHPTLRPHRLDVALIGPDGTVTAVPAVIDDLRERVEDAAGMALPEFVYPNYGDHGYAKVALDPVSTAWAQANVASITEPLLRQQTWASLWEMVRDRQFASTDYLALARRGLKPEGDASIVQMVTATVAAALARYVPEDLIETEAAAFVTAGRAAIDAVPAGDMRVLWARAVLGAAITPEDARFAATLVDVPPEGLAIDQDMRWSVAVRWAALELDGAADRLQSERVRDPSDRGDRMMTMAEAARPDLLTKDEVWERIHGGGYDSLHLAMAAGAGFWQRTQRDLLEPLVPRFFAGLPALFGEWETEAARAYFRTLFPWHRIEASTREMVQDLLADDAIGPMLRRMLVEADDDLARAIACREFAAPVQHEAAGSGNEPPGEI